MSRIVSSLPGRIRVRDKRLRDQERLAELKKELSKITAITALQDDVRTGSIVVDTTKKTNDFSSIIFILCSPPCHIEFHCVHHLESKILLRPQRPARSAQESFASRNIECD